MSEKRFVLATSEKWFLFDNETEEYMDMEDCKDKLNEQQFVIDEQNQRIRKLENILKKFQFPVERVGQLQRENEQLKYDNFMFKGVIETFQKVAISERKKLEKEIEEQQATIKKQSIRIHCQDQEIQRLLNKIQEMKSK